jgi:hypothetical protein
LLLWQLISIILYCDIRDETQVKITKINKTGGNRTLFYSRMLVGTQVLFCLSLTNPGFINYTKKYFEISIIMSI